MAIVWRTVDGCLMKRCPTCAKRGREPWHHLYEFSRDATRRNGIAIRCLLCGSEDHAAWVAADPARYQRYMEGVYQRRAAEGRNARDSGSYYRRKRAAGYRRSGGKWVRTPPRRRGQPRQARGPRQPQQRKKADRDRAIVARYGDGESQAALARAYGLSRERVRQIVRGGRR